MNKRGLSGVVVAILIVLIAVVAVTIFWVALRPVIVGTTEDIGGAQSCILLNLEIREAIYNSTLNTLSVKVHRDVGEAELSGIKFFIDGEEKTATPSEGLSELSTKPYTISGLSVAPSKIEIAGVLTGDKLCGVADSVEGTEIQTI